MSPCNGSSLAKSRTNRLDKNIMVELIVLTRYKYEVLVKPIRLRGSGGSEPDSRFSACMYYSTVSP